jgi:hypothetical protein
MFWSTQDPSSGSQSQYLAKITSMVALCLSIGKVFSVMAAYAAITLTTFHIDKHSGTILVNLARY